METVDYGKVIGMVHPTESFGAVDGPGIRFIVFLQRLSNAVSILPYSRYLGNGTNKLRERTVDDVSEEALRYRGFWGQKGESLSVVEKPSCRLTFDCPFTKAQELGIHCTLDTCALPFRNTSLFGKFGPLDGSDILGAS